MNEKTHGYVGTLTLFFWMSDMVARTIPPDTGGYIQCEWTGQGYVATTEVWMPYGEHAEYFVSTNRGWALLDTVKVE